jgi:hypothetical protein
MTGPAPSISPRDRDAELLVYRRGAILLTTP